MTYLCLSSCGKLSLEQHLHFVVLQKDEGCEESGEPILWVVCVEGALQVTENIFPQRTEDAMNNNRGDLVIEVWRK